MAVVNMAGILRFDDTEELQTDDWQKVIDINLTGTMFLCRAALPHLLETKGSIVNAASTAALSGLPCGLAYSASKGGVLAMTRSIAVEYAKRGVRANCICPGDINTGMTDKLAFPKSMDFKLMPRIMSLTRRKIARGSGRGHRHAGVRGWRAHHRRGYPSRRRYAIVKTFCFCRLLFLLLECVAEGADPVCIGAEIAFTYPGYRTQIK